MLYGCIYAAVWFVNINTQPVLVNNKKEGWEQFLLLCYSCPQGRGGGGAVNVMESIGSSAEEIKYMYQ